MNPQMRAKLEHLLERREEINALLSDPAVIGNQNSFRDLSIELADISPVVEHFEAYQALDAELASTREMVEDSDPDIRRMANDELPRLQNDLEESFQTLRKLLIPKDPNDERNIFLEVRAGTGGDEAAIFLAWCVEHGLAESLHSTLSSNLLWPSPRVVWPSLSRLRLIVY